MLLQILSTNTNSNWNNKKLLPRKSDKHNFYFFSLVAQMLIVFWVALRHFIPHKWLDTLFDQSESTKKRNNQKLLRKCSLFQLHSVKIDCICLLGISSGVSIVFGRRRTWTTENINSWRNNQNHKIHWRSKEWCLMIR